jgi:hypothetical protein
MADPYTDDLPPYRIPRSYHVAIVIPARVTDWSDLFVFTGGQDFIEGSRKDSTIRLALSATVTALEIGVLKTYTGTHDCDSVNGQRMGHIGDGLVPLEWKGQAGGGFNDTADFYFLHDPVTPQHRVRPTGYLTLNVASPTPVTRQVRFFFNKADIAAPGIHDLVGTFTFLGGTVDFLAADIGTGGTVTAASIVTSVV